MTGFLDRRARRNREHSEQLVSAMADRLRHRGPDGAGAWSDPRHGVALGHRRLSIVDLSPSGAQPMASRDGRYVISYNGEIYNHAELRAELEAGGHTFRGTSDTEVLVECFAVFGIEAALQRLIGMFALAVWDSAEATLHLVRDRMGIKPLYYGRFGDLLVFGSSLAALRAHPDWTPEIDRGALCQFMRVGYVPAPNAIYSGVFKLAPGEVCSFGPAGDVERRRYWDLRALAPRWRAEPHAGDDTALVDGLERVLSDAVRRRMVADVPLGAFLSGGIDSSTVAALMQAQSARPVRTFAIGFRQADFDEAGYARRVAAHLGTDHTELYLEPRQVREVIPALPRWYDEPFADPSQIPTLLLSELTRREVTVALSGDGGDELFAGYNRYLATLKFWGPISRVPQSVRRRVAQGLRLVPPSGWQRGFDLLPPRLRPPQAGDKVHKLARLIAARGPEAFYANTITHWHQPEALVHGGEEPARLLDDADLSARFPDTLDWMQYLDSVTYLPDDILTKVDRASMAHSLEARVPILDHRVVEYAWRIPPDKRVRGGQGKWPLRQILYRHLPRELMDRPKMGFGVPLAEWLRGPLRAWADDLLAPDRVAREGLLDPAVVEAAWREHREGRRDWHYPLWNVLMFQAWHAEAMSG